MLEMLVAHCPRHEFQEAHKRVLIGGKRGQLVVEGKIHKLTDGRLNICGTLFRVLEALSCTILDPQIFKL